MSNDDSKTVMQRERMRLGQVRKSFAAGVEMQSAGAAVPLEFLTICVDYIKASMDRLHAQDQRIHDILKPHVMQGETENSAILDHLNVRLSKSRAALAELVAARDQYRAKPATGWASFKAIIDMFMDVYFNTLLKGQHSTLGLQNKVFTDQTWNDVAGVSQDSRVTEATLFAEVKKAAPTGADPESFPSSRPAA